MRVKEGTVLAWAHRYDWDIPTRRRPRVVTNAIKLRGENAITPSEALIETHAELESTTKTALMQVLAKAATTLAAKGGALPMETIVQFKEACLAGAKLFGWDGKPEVTVAVNNQVSVEVSDAKRQELINLRNEALAERDDEPSAARPAPAELSEAERELRREGWEPGDDQKPAPARQLPAPLKPETGLTNKQRIEDYRPVEDYRKGEIEEILGG
jgi:hypothetical protein